MQYTDFSTDIRLMCSVIKKFIILLCVIYVLKLSTSFITIDRLKQI
jgi:hypothetical protein